MTYTLIILKHLNQQVFLFSDEEAEVAREYEMDPLVQESPLLSALVVSTDHQIRFVRPENWV